MNYYSSLAALLIGSLTMFCAQGMDHQTLLKQPEIEKLVPVDFDQTAINGEPTISPEGKILHKPLKEKAYLEDSFKTKTYLNQVLTFTSKGFFSPNGLFLIIEDGEYVLFFNTSTEKCFKRLDFPNSNTLRVVWGPGREYYNMRALIATNNKLQVYSTMGDVVSELNADGACHDEYDLLRFGSDCTSIYTRGKDANNIFCWEAETGKLKCILTGEPSKEVFKLDKPSKKLAKTLPWLDRIALQCQEPLVTAVGNLIIAIAYDKTVKVFGRTTQTHFKTLECKNKVTGIVLSANVLKADEEETALYIQDSENRIYHCKFYPDDIEEFKKDAIKDFSEQVSLLAAMPKKTVHSPEAKPEKTVHSSKNEPEKKAASQAELEKTAHSPKNEPSSKPPVNAPQLIPASQPITPISAHKLSNPDCSIL